VAAGEQRLVRVLAVEVDEGGTVLGEGGDRRRPPVHVRPAPPSAGITRDSTTSSPASVRKRPSTRASTRRPHDVASGAPPTSSSMA
jgi:hypothetical protein